MISFGAIARRVNAPMTNPLRVFLFAGGYLLIAAASARAGTFDLPEEARPPSPERVRVSADKLISAGGITEIEGAAGGGIVPWALIAGGGTDERVGASASYTNVSLNDYKLDSAGAALGFYDRLEISFAQQAFQLTGSVAPGNTIKQQIVGAKIRLWGDAIFAQDGVLPQIAAGTQYKRNQDFGFVSKAVGARGDSGTDFYVSATKLYFGALAGRNLLLNATVRGTRANQAGLLGFGGDRNNGYKACFEGSAAVFLNDQTAVGGEYRTMPDNLGASKQDDWRDAFVAYFPNKSLALTVAYAMLGHIVGKDQSGLYLSVQASY